MAQVHTVSNVVPTFQGKLAYSSLSEMILSIATETKPVTLRQVTKLGYYDTETVAAALQEKTNAGDLAAFKIGVLDYYASPLAALTMKNPPFTSVAVETFKHTVWKSKLIFVRWAGKFTDSAAW